MKNKYIKYLQQYLTSTHLQGVMEFSEFLAEKLNITEPQAIKLISKQKTKAYETAGW